MINWSEFLDKLDKVEEDLLGDINFFDMDILFDIEAIDEIREMIYGE
jgi:hypothetical protein